MRLCCLCPLMLVFGGAADEKKARRGRPGAISTDKSNLAGGGAGAAAVAAVAVENSPGSSASGDNTGKKGRQVRLYSGGDDIVTAGGTVRPAPIQIDQHRKDSVKDGDEDAAAMLKLKRARHLEQRQLKRRSMPEKNRKHDDEDYEYEIEAALDRAKEQKEAKEAKEAAAAAAAAKS